MHIQTSAKPVAGFVSFGSDTEQRWSSLKDQESTETLSSTRNALKTVRNSVNWSRLWMKEVIKVNNPSERASIHAAELSVGHTLTPTPGRAAASPAPGDSRQAKGAAEPQWVYRSWQPVDLDNCLFCLSLELSQFFLKKSNSSGTGLDIPASQYTLTFS